MANKRRTIFNIDNLESLNGSISDDDLIVLTSNKIGSSGDRQYLVKYSVLKAAIIAGISDGTFEYDIINEFTAAHGVIIDGVLLKDSQVNTNVINELTSAAGVTIDGLTLKDGDITGDNGAYLKGWLSLGANYTVAQLAFASNDAISIDAANTTITAPGAVNVAASGGATTITASTQVSLGAVNGIIHTTLPVNKPTPVAINSTTSATASQIVRGCITSTSAAATAITTPTATAIAAIIGAVAGTSFEFIVDNSAGANTVTLILDASITVIAAVITGGDTLTVASGTVGIFKVYFISGVAAKISRIA